MNANNNDDQMVNVEEFANMAGFPVELVKKELFDSSNPSDEMSLKDLRAAMLSYLNETMLTEK